jgi:hypothetical protein
MNVDDVRNLLRTECARLGGEAQFARVAGVSPQLIYAVRSGVREPRGKVLNALGIEMVYRKKRPIDLPVKRRRSSLGQQSQPE